jgi:hypothetical protein
LGYQDILELKITPCQKNRPPTFWETRFKTIHHAPEGHIDFKESGKEGILRNIPQNQT